MNFLYLLFVISVVGCSDINRIFGDWTLLALFPKDNTYTACATTTVSDENRNVKCNCDDEEAEYPVIKMYVHPLKDRPLSFNVTAPVKVVDKYDPHEVNGFFNKTCKCDGFPRLGLIRIVNDDFIVHYRKQSPANYTEREPNLAALHSKVLPTKVQLIKLVKSDEELKNRDGGYLCQDLIF